MSITEEQKQYKSALEFMTDYVLEPETNNFIDYNKISFQEAMMIPLIVPFNQELETSNRNDSDKNKRKTSLYSKEIKIRRFNALKKI